MEETEPSVSATCSLSTLKSIKSQATVSYLYPKCNNVRKDFTNSNELHKDLLLVH